MLIRSWKWEFLTEKKKKFIFLFCALHRMKKKKVNVILPSKMTKRNPQHYSERDLREVEAKEKEKKVISLVWESSWLHVAKVYLRQQIFNIRKLSKKKEESKNEA